MTERTYFEPGSWPVWLRRAFICTLPISAPLWIAGHVVIALIGLPVALLMDWRIQYCRVDFRHVEAHPVTDTAAQRLGKLAAIRDHLAEMAGHLHAMKAPIFTPSAVQALLDARIILQPHTPAQIEAEVEAVARMIADNRNGSPGFPIMNTDRELARAIVNRLMAGWGVGG